MVAISATRPGRRRGGRGGEWDERRKADPGASRVECARGAAEGGQLWSVAPWSTMAALLPAEAMLLTAAVEELGASCPGQVRARPASAAAKRSIT